MPAAVIESQTSYDETLLLGTGDTEHFSQLIWMERAFKIASITCYIASWTDDPDSRAINMYVEMRPGLGSLYLPDFSVAAYKSSVEASTENFDVWAPTEISFTFSSWTTTEFPPGPWWFTYKFDVSRLRINNAGFGGTRGTFGRNRVLHYKNGSGYPDPNRSLYYQLSGTVTGSGMPMLSVQKYNSVVTTTIQDEDS